jgi:uncharacterized sulfatase
MATVVNRKAIAVLVLLIVVVAGSVLSRYWPKLPQRPPNLLLVITDDQSWIHTGYSSPVLRTPNFDRIANEGVYFDNAFTSAPTCTASRSAILTGQHFWRLGPAAQLWGDFPAELVNYQRLLEQHGYLVGYTGKGWGPGKSASGNPAGQDYNKVKRDVDPAFSTIDHVANLQLFLANKKPDQPFSFWVSPTEPHRPFKEHIGVDSGRFKLAEIPVPPFLPDNDKVRSDIADYLYEIEWFDEELGRVLAVLEQAGELDNTVIVYTSDNGMAFPRAKSNNYDYGTHVPLAVRWGKGIDTPHRVTDFISLTDLAPTFLTLAGVPVPPEMTGKSFVPQLQTDKSGRIDPLRNVAFTGFQRHIGNARIESRGYPARAVHSDDYLYIENFTPDRWPAGRPPSYADIDEGSPTKNVMRSDPAYQDLLALAGDKRPTQELYRVQQDTANIRNVADNPEYSTALKTLAETLRAEMKRTGDPQSTGQGAIFDSYPYHGDKH